MRDLTPGQRYKVYLSTWDLTGWFESELDEVAEGGGDRGTAIFKNGVHLGMWGLVENKDSYGWTAEPVGVAVP